MNQDRDPQDEATLAAFVVPVLAAVDADPETQEATAKALFDELARQGVLTQDEADEAWLEDVAADGMTVWFDDQDLFLTANGEVKTH